MSPKLDLTDAHKARSAMPFVGCAGWSLRPQVAAEFGNGSSHLARYASRFNAVEINSSFYRPHRRGTYERWAATVPAGFRFSVKVPRQITHERRLVGVDEALDRFISEVSGLGDKLGMLLVQLPPSLLCDWRVACSFFRSIRGRVKVPIACEARHPSWFTSEIDKALADEEIIRVIADPPVAGDTQALRLVTTYLRLHGSPRMYYSPYSLQQVEEFARRLSVLWEAGVTAWCIFDNTASGAAIENALQTSAILGARLGL
jgi:uncharacterized protein YecE (DUF72 family)